MIVPMKKVTIFALADDRRALLSALQRRSLVMITSDGETDRVDIGAGADEAKLQRASDAISFADKYKQKEGMLKQKPTLSYEELIEENSEDAALAEKVLAIKDRIQVCENRILTLRSANAMLLPWRKLAINLNELNDTRYAKVRTGFFPDRSLSELESIEELGGSVELFDGSPSGMAALLVSHRDHDDEIYDRAKELGFADATPPYSERTADAVFTENEGEIQSLEAEIDELKKDAEKAAEEIGALRRLRDREATDLALDESAYGATDAVFYIEGWARSDQEERLKKTIEDVTEYYVLESRDPEADEKPPTVTKNNKFISQFETITDMFSRPGPRDAVDPNPVMGIWYWIIFGMMMGDAGYGLLMVVLIGIFKLVTKNNGKMVNILFYSGFTTIIWGVMFGSYFGEEWFPPLLLLPLSNILLSMGLCLGIGALHIFSGIGMQMYVDFKEGRPWDAIFDQLSQIVLLVGLVMLFVEPLKTAGMVMTALGGGTMLLAGGRKSPKFVSKITGGLGKIYNSVIGLFSDILSYARILALMLSSGIIAMVMNILAGMVMPKAGASIVGFIIGGIFGLAIYVVGHVFNLVLSLLSAYVHDSRLQYLEFFGKFYEGGGYEFEPLAPDVKYVQIADGDE